MNNILFVNVFLEPNHLTELSSSLIDILLLTNTSHLILSDVGDPFYPPPKAEGYWFGAVRLSGFSVRPSVSPHDLMLTYYFMLNI